MKPLFSDSDLQQAKSRDLLPFQCCFCDCMFTRNKKNYLDVLKGNRPEIQYCSNSCTMKHKHLQKYGELSQTLQCQQCGDTFIKAPRFIKRTKNHFCSRSCAATYNNAHKKYGIRRSKLEAWLEEQLTKIYPNLEIHFNRRDAVNSELDIYFPSLNLAFELNGIFHYEPIFGEDQLNKIQNNDQRKFQACIEAKIELCIIDTSGQKYFKESSSQKYLNIITKLVNKKLSKTDCEEVL